MIKNEENKEEVKQDEIEFETSYVKPSSDEELVETPEETPLESSPEDQSGKEPKEQLVRRQEIPPKEPKEVEGETPREKALRLETQRLRGLLRKQRGSEIMGETPKPSFFVKNEKKDDKQEILEKYNPEEINNLKEVLGVMADDLGFVKKDEYRANTYQEVFQEEWDKFLKVHKEYLPENDKDDVLWNRFREEFKLYAKPQNPRDFKKIFNRVNTTIFGSPTDELKKINAQQEKIKNASHAGATPASSVSRPSHRASGIRTDMLKGFTQEEIDEMLG